MFFNDPTIAVIILETIVWIGKVSITGTMETIWIFRSRRLVVAVLIILVADRSVAAIDIFSKVAIHFIRIP